MERAFARFDRRLLLIVFVLLSVLALAAPMSAGQAQEASIIGQVTDESGAVLPGVTVTTTSPALQVPQVTAVTDERGEYRLRRCPSARMRCSTSSPASARCGGRTSG